MSELEELVARAVEGDSAAFARLYKMSSRQVYFTCLGFVKNESDAEDLMQETFFTVVMKLSTLNDKNSFQAWVNRIAVNKCKNFVAKKSPDFYQQDFEEAGIELPNEEISLPDEYVVNEEKRKIIMDIIMTKLSDAQRQTVIMYYYNDMTTVEISKEMECPIGTVTYRLSSARKAIEKEILRYEKISKDRLHSVSLVPFLTTLLRTEAEKIHMPKTDLSPIISSAANISTAASSSGETIHSIGSTVIAAVTAVVLGSSVTAYYVNRHGDDIDTSPGYEYYELLNEEYENSRYKNCFNNPTYWDGENVYFESQDMSDYFCYNPEENTLDTIIPSSRQVSLDIDSKMTDCTIITQFHSNYYFHENIYSIGYMKFDEPESQTECALIKYDMDGNIEDYFILEGLYHDYDPDDRVEKIGINGITEDGRIYIAHAEIKLPDNVATIRTTQTTYYRINTDFKGFEKDLDFTNNNSDYFCGNLEYCNGKLYAFCSVKGNYQFSEDDYSSGLAVYAYDEETLEPVEDDFFVQNNIELSYPVGKYMVTPDAIYDTDTNEILADIPESLGDQNFFLYYGGGYHYYMHVTDSVFEIQKVKLSDNIDYENAGDEILDSLENDGIVRTEKFSYAFEILDSDTYFIYEPEGTYFCRFSTGEKTKLQFPWSVHEE